MRHTTQLLFGGALFAAGIAPSATAQLFQFEPNQGGASPCARVTAYATDDPSGTPILCVHTAYDPAYAQQAAGADTGTTYAMALTMGDTIGAYEAIADRFGATPGSGVAYASAYAVFSVNAGVDAEVVWYFADEHPAAPFSASSLSLVEHATGAPVFEVAPGDADGGFQEVTLTPGVVYRFSCTAWAFEPSDGTTALLTLRPNTCRRCDVDANGVLNLDDINAFATAFITGDIAVADCDGCGVINLDDINCFAQCFLSGGRVRAALTRPDGRTLCPCRPGKRTSTGSSGPRTTTRG